MSKNIFVGGKLVNPEVKVRTINEKTVVLEGSQGDFWELAIAVPIKNRKFEYGKIKEYTLSPGRLNTTYQGGLKAPKQRITELGLSSSNQSYQDCPSNIFQYGDKVTIGPSTHSDDEGQVEYLRVSGSWDNKIGYQEYTWTDGGVLLRDRYLKYSYNFGDKVTVYGSGLADGWELDKTYNQMSCLGISRGYSSLNNHGFGRLIKDASDTNAFQDIYIDGSTDWLGVTGGFSFYLPDDDTYIAYINQYNYSTISTISALSTDSSIYNANYLVKLLSNRMLDMWADQDCCYINYYSGLPGNIRRTADTGEYGLAHLVAPTMSSSVDSSSRAFIYYKQDYTNGIDKWPVTELTNQEYIITPFYGFYHEGGLYSPYAQSLGVFGNKRKEISASDHTTRGELIQYLTVNRGALSDSNVSGDKFNPAEVTLPSHTFYRMGCVFKGWIQPGDAGCTVHANSAWSMRLLSGHRFNNASLISMDLIGATRGQGRDISDWTEQSTSGYVGQVQPFMSDNTSTIETHYYPQLSIKGNMQSGSYGDSAHGYTGTQGFLLLDNVYLEHQGDLGEAEDTLGYITLNSRPELGTVNYRILSNPGEKEITMSDNTQYRVDVSGTGDRLRYSLSASFVNISQDDWEKIQGLLRWQRNGYMLTLHPYLDDLPNVLVGYLNIKSIQKNFWDLSRRSFQFEFKEAD